MKYSLIIFDADETLRHCTVPDQPCPNRPGEWELLPGVKKKLISLAFTWAAKYPSQATLKGGGIGYGIASNQAGIAHGFLSQDMAYRLLFDTFCAAFGFLPATGTIEICPHEEGVCDCRKPKPLMLQNLMRLWDVKPEYTLLIGDMESDKQAAENAGCDFMWAEDFFGWDNNADFFP